MKIDMEKRFGPGGSNEQVNDIVKQVAEEIRTGKSSGTPDLLELLKKGKRFHEKEENIRRKP
jgi:hypothetical protein